jgi:hypothetical protein
MNNPMINMAMNMLKNRNPQGYNMINNAMNNGTNPQGFLKQVMGNATPQQIQNIMQMGKQFGIPDEVLSQIQNMK